MEIVLYTAFLLTGIIFGSFFTLAVYRIPRKENIVYGRSHCTSCNHRLEFLDLIPIFSYLFLGGKCRYCGEKIRIRYLLLEIFSGLVFLLIGITYGTQKIVDICFIYLFIAGMFIIAGIDKENFMIPTGLRIYELIIAFAHLGFIIWKESTYVEYLIGFTIVPIALFVLNKVLQIIKKQEKEVTIKFDYITYIAIIGLMFGYKIQLISIVFLCIVSIILKMIRKLDKIPYAFYYTISTIILVIIIPYIEMMIRNI